MKTWETLMKTWETRTSGSRPPGSFRCPHPARPPRFPGVVSLALVLLSGAFAGTSSGQTLNLPPHPRLIVYGTATNPTRLEELRSQVDETGDPLGWSERKKALVLAFRSLRAGSWVWHGKDLEAEWAQRPVNQDEQVRCIATLALTDLLMKNKGSLYPEYAGRRIYAEKANAFLHWWRDHGYLNWGQNPDIFQAQNELGYAELLAAYALFYDWCHDFLDFRERAYHARAIYRLMTDAPHLYVFPYGDWRSGWYDNNHLGVIFGAVGLAALALDQGDPVFNQTARDSISWFRQKAATRAREYLDASFPIDGAAIEGLLYANYGLNLALPYALATERLRTVAQGYDALPGSMRVDGPRNAYQVPTWLYYEQLPFNPCGGTPLNDTSVLPYDMNPSFRAWPWLMAFSTSVRPTLATPFFYTIYPPAVIDQAVTRPFDYRAPDAASDPFDVRDVIDESAVAQPSVLGSHGILLAWPESPSYPALDPRDLPRARYFSGRGITYFRSGVQLLRPDGTRDFRPDSCLITFECRQHPTWPSGFNQWSGHTQQDVNHFTMFFGRQPLFYDAGYAGWGRFPSFHSSAHSLHEIRIGNGSWRGFESYKIMGVAIPSVIGAGDAPSFAGGNNTECWPSTDVARSVRRMIVLPRPGRPAPYVFIHDDMELRSTGRVKAIMQTGNEYEGDNANRPLLAGNVARWSKEQASAVLAFLAPSVMALSTPFLMPNDTASWPAHWMVHAETSSARTRHQIVSMIEPRWASDGTPELVELQQAVGTSDPEGLAWQVESGHYTDVVAFRPFDRTGNWWIYPQGWPVVEGGAASAIAVRFESGRPVPSYILRSPGGLEVLGGTSNTAPSGSGSSTGSAPHRAPSAGEEQDPTRTTPVAAGADLIDRPVVPNPLRIGDVIHWSGASASSMLEIYDIAGRLVRVVVPFGGSSGGVWHLTWDGRGEREELRAGVYLLRFRRDGWIHDRPVQFLR